MTRKLWPLPASVAFLLACAAGLPARAGADPAANPTASTLPAAAPAVAADGQAEESRKLSEILDAYFEEYLQINPMLATSIGDPRYNDRYEVQISPAWRARFETLERSYLERIKGIDHGRLGPEDRISHEVFKSARETEIEGLRFPTWLIPLNQFYSVPNTFVQLGSGGGLQPFKTVKDYDDFLKRVDGLVAWTDQAIANMREGVAKGYTLPRVLAGQVLPQLDSQLVARPEDSLYWGPVKNMPASFAEADRTRLTAAYRANDRDESLPCLPQAARLHARRIPAQMPRDRGTGRAARRQGLVRVQRP